MLDLGTPDKIIQMVEFEVCCYLILDVTLSPGGFVTYAER